MSDAKICRTALDTLQRSWKEDHQTTTADILKSFTASVGNNTNWYLGADEDYVHINAIEAQLRRLKNAGDSWPKSLAAGIILMEAASYLSNLWLREEWNEAIPEPTEEVRRIEKYSCPCPRCEREDACFEKKDDRWFVSCSAENGCGYDKGFSHIGYLIKWVMEESKNRVKANRPKMTPPMHPLKTVPAAPTEDDVTTTPETRSDAPCAGLKHDLHQRDDKQTTSIEAPPLESVDTPDPVAEVRTEEKSPDSMTVEDAMDILREAAQSVEDLPTQEVEINVTPLLKPESTPKYRCPGCEGEMVVTDVVNEISGRDNAKIVATCLGVCKFKRVFAPNEFKEWQTQANSFRRHLQEGS